MESLIRDLACEKPLLLHGGQLFEMSQGGDGVFVYAHEGKTWGFEESLPLVPLESSTYQSVLERKANEAARRIEEEKEARSLRGTILDVKDPLQQFLVYFLCQGKPDKISSLTGSLKKSVGTTVSFHKDLSLYGSSERISFLERTAKDGLPDTSSVLFMNDHVFGLVEGAKEKGFGVVKQYRAGRLVRVMPLVPSKQKVSEVLALNKQVLEKRITDMVRSEKDRCMRQLRKESRKSPGVDLDRASSFSTDRGYVQDHGKMYVYVVKPSFTIDYLGSPRKRFRFPDCRIGLEVLHDGRHFSFVEPTLILASKSISGGVVRGGFRNLFNGEYLHPATLSEPNDFPHLCIAGRGFSGYAQKSFADPKSFFQKVNGLLNTAAHVIEHGYYRKGSAPGTVPETAAVYHYFDHADFVAKLAHHCVRRVA